MAMASHTAKDASLAHTNMLKLPEVLATIGVSRAAFYRMRARGQAPRIHRLPNGHIRVRRDDLDAWLDDLATNSV